MSGPQGFGYFVTGTDTDIGKTVVATTLAIGLKASYWKPIQTGSVLGSDSDFVRKWLPPSHVLPEVYSYPQPLSPHLAAEAHGDVIELERCLKAYEERHPKPASMIIEGAGGVLVPLNSRHLMVHLIQKLNLPVIVVASTKLGTLNHTLMTLMTLRSYGVSIKGLITNGEPRPEISQSLCHFGEITLLGHISPCPSFHLEWFKTSFSTFSRSLYEYAIPFS